MIRKRWIADLVYLLMKPLEWFFVIVLYLTEVHPEDRIDLPLCLAYSEANEKPYVQRLVTFIRNGVRR